MRPIKFRLIQDKKIVGYLRLKNGWTQFQAIGRENWYYPCDFKWTDAEQFTGRLLSDSTIEIYEGSRVNLIVEDGGQDYKYAGTIVWYNSDSCFSIKLDTDEDGVYPNPLADYGDHELEIIHDKEKP